MLDFNGSLKKIGFISVIVALAGVVIIGNLQKPNTQVQGIETVVTETPTPTLLPTDTPTPTPSLKPTNTPVPTVYVPPATPTSTPTPKPIVLPTSTPIPVQTQSTNPPVNPGGGYACNCSKTCTQISSCAEAQYLLNNCGCSARDGDHDGIACDSAPLHCQN